MTKRSNRSSTATTANPRNRVESVIDGVMEAVILLILVVTPWLFGGTQPQHIYLATCSLVLVLLLWAVKQIIRWKLTLHFCWVTILLVLLFLYSALYLVPLPRTTLSWLSPEAARLYDSLIPQVQEQPMASDLNEVPAFPPGSTLSLYPGATQFALVQLLTAIVLFFVVRHSLATPERLKRLAWVLVINGCVLSIFALIQKVRAPVYTIYGIVVPGDPFGPFINRNHFCSYVNFSIFLGLGLFLSIMQTTTGAYRVTETGQKVPVQYSFSLWTEILQRPQAMWLLIPVAVCMTAVLASLSRGGILAFAVGMALAILAWQRKGESKGILLFLTIPAIAFAFLLWYGAAPTLQRIEENSFTQEGRFTIWQACLSAFTKFPIVGTGFGTFQTVEPIYRIAGADQVTTHEHAHSEYMEALVEGGLLRLILTLALIWLVLRQGWQALNTRKRGNREALLLGAWAACITLAVQSIGEFGIQLPAVAGVLAVTAGYLVGLGGRRSESEEDSSLINWHFFGVGPVIALAFAVTVGFMLFAGTWLNWQFEANRIDGLRLRQTAKGDSAQLQKAVERLDAAIYYEPAYARARMERFEIENQRLQAIEVHERAVFERCISAQMVVRLRTGILRMQNDPLATLTEDAIQPFLSQALLAKQNNLRITESWKSQQRHLQAARNLSPLLWRPHLDIAQHVLPTKSELAPQDRLIYWKTAEPMETYLGRVKLLQPYRASSWFLCGELEWLNGMRDNAVVSWQRSLELSDEFLEPIVQAAALAALQPEFKFTTQEIMDKLIPPNTPRQYVKAAWLLYPGADKMAERKPYMDKAISILEKKPDLTSAENQYVYGLAMWGIDKKEQALQHLLAAMQGQPENTTWRLDLGRLCVELEKYAEAREHLQLVIRLQSSNVEALLLLEKLDKLQRPSRE